VRNSRISKRYLERSLILVWVSCATLILLRPFAAAAQQTQIPSPPAGEHAHQHPSGEQVDLFPAREASGTSWLPDETPMFGVPRTWRGWNLMFHGTAFGQFIYEPGDIHRTGGFDTGQVSSVNWGMAMARRAVGPGRVGVRLMGSIEEWTVTNCGFLNLLATGEICEGDTIHDRQHPHDLFMELADDYDHPLRESLRWQVYAGLAGEPALGPSAFPHRVSAIANPVAPISHHWLDSSHITFGVITTGIYHRRWKAEMSLFNGREPDDGRADLDLAALDSVSARFSFLPTLRLAIQVSAGHLNEAEAEFAPQPRTDLDRFTASATYHRTSGQDVWAATLAYGINSGVEIIPGAEVDLTTHALLLEGSVTFAERHTWFGRAEVVGKPAHDLHAHEYADRVFAVGKLQAGYARAFKPWRRLVPSVGGSVSLAIVPPELEPRYTRQVAPGFGVFVSIRPARHVM
jgi:hypothetical protein